MGKIICFIVPLMAACTAIQLYAPLDFDQQWTVYFVSEKVYALLLGLSVLKAKLTEKQKKIALITCLVLLSEFLQELFGVRAKGLFISELYVYALFATGLSIILYYYDLFNIAKKWLKKQS